MINVESWLEKIEACRDSDELEAIRLELFGKKGVVTEGFISLKSLDGDTKKEVAAGLNRLKEAGSALITQKKNYFTDLAIEQQLIAEKIDVSSFSFDAPIGAIHPIMDVMDQIIDYFTALNFSIETGPMVDNDFNNFEALNLPKYHPARDMQDTFYFKDDMLLRTHTSTVQIRTMMNSQPPIRMIAPGAVCRRDYDATHVPMFHQIEGLVVDEAGKVTFAHLKAILEEFLTTMFGDIKVRFRPSFFPFTEPSAEVDISCIFCHGDGCRVCKETGWLEVLGCGVVDPNVFKAVGYENVSGYAFGMGVERFAMLLKKVSDMRGFYEGDLRLLEQFR